MQGEWQTGFTSKSERERFERRRAQTLFSRPIFSEAAIEIDESCRKEVGERGHSTCQQHWRVQNGNPILPAHVLREFGPNPLGWIAAWPASVTWRGVSGSISNCDSSATGCRMRKRSRSSHSLTVNWLFAHEVHGDRARQIGATGRHPISNLAR